jgi:SRSO17 transposase
VHLAYARDDFHALLDGELFLPESWSADRPRCRAAKIPDSMAYRFKWQIALKLFDGAVVEGLQFEWITADEGYGSKPGFLEGLESRKQRFIVDVIVRAWWAPELVAKVHYDQAAERIRYY